MLHQQPVVTGTHGKGAAWTKNKLTAEAPIWRVYHDFAQNYDEGMLRDWSSSIDTMLIFAGIFAATTTAFIIEAYKQMEPDYTQLLFIALTTRDNTSSAALPAKFVAPTSARVVNRLWIGSLIIGLFAALVAILAKQWLCAYRVQNGGDLREWAQLRQFRFDCLGRWRVPEIIACIPLLLHISLLLFLTGLVVFMAPIDYGTMILALIVFVLGFVVYLGSMLSPLIWSSSPYRTQLTPVVGRLVACIGRSFRALGNRLRNTLDKLSLARDWQVPDSTDGNSELPSATTDPSLEDPWHFIDNADDPRTLALPLGWLATIASSGQILSELVDAFGDMNVGRESLSAQPPVVHCKLAAIVAEILSKPLPAGGQPVDDCQPGLRIFNTATSLAVPMNVDHRIETMCLAVCKHRELVLSSVAEGDVEYAAFTGRPVFDALSTAALWLSLHSDVEIETFSTARLVSSPAKYGLPVSMGLALLDSVETCPMSKNSHTRVEKGHRCGITRIFYLLMIWRELFVTDETVERVLDCLRRLLGEAYRDNLLIWQGQGEDPKQKLAFALALEIHSGFRDHFALKSTLFPLLRHLVWLLCADDLDVARFQFHPAACAYLCEVAGTDGFMRPAIAYPAFVALEELGKRTMDEELLSMLHQLMGFLSETGMLCHALLCNALDVYNPEQLRAFVNLIRKSTILANSVPATHGPFTVMGLLGTCVLQARGDPDQVQWFAHLLLARSGYAPLSGINHILVPWLGSWISDSIVGEVLWGLRAAAAPGRDLAKRCYCPLATVVAAIHDFMMSGGVDSFRWYMLAEDVYYGLGSKLTLPMDPTGSPSKLWERAREAIREHPLKSHLCGEMDTDGIEDALHADEHAQAIYALADFRNTLRVGRDNWNLALTRTIGGWQVDGGAPEPDDDPGPGFPREIVCWPQGAEVEILGTLSDRPSSVAGIETKSIQAIQCEGEGLVHADEGSVQRRIAHISIDMEPSRDLEPSRDSGDRRRRENLHPSPTQQTKASGIIQPCESDAPGKTRGEGTCQLLESGIGAVTL